MKVSGHRRRFETPGQARFLTFSCYRRLPLFDNDRIKDAVVEQFRVAQTETKFETFAWVVMPEHIHLLIVPSLPTYPVGEVLRKIKEPLARRVLKRWTELEAPVLSRLTDPRGHRHFWQRGGGYDRNLFSETQVREKADYIHANPVRRGLVERAEQWRWSSMRFYAGRAENILD